MKIGLLLYPDCLTSGLFAFSEMLRAANLRTGKRLFDCVWVSRSGEAFCRDGLTLNTMALPGAELDALLIPGAWRDQSSIQNESDDALIDAIGALPTTVAVFSYCTGVYLAAKAGRLDRQRATTTWWLLDSIRDHFPRTQWQLNSTFIANKRNATAAGVHGYQPIALSLIEQRGSKALASAIQQYMVLPRPIERNTPFQALPELVQQNPFLRQIVQWVEACPYSQLQTTALAAHLNLTPRTLSRHIVSMTPYNTLKLMRLIKLNQVSDQLISSRQSIATISDAMGFTDDTSLRRSFKQITGMTPGDYRRTFG